MQSVKPPLHAEMHLRSDFVKRQVGTMSNMEGADAGPWPPEQGGPIAHT